jgi:integrase
VAIASKSPAQNLLSLATTKMRHIGDDLKIELYPDLWTDEYTFLNAPRQAQVQSDLFYDYQLLSVLRRLHMTLAKGGTLFVSVQLGEGEQQLHDGRYFAYYTSNEFAGFLCRAGFSVDASAECLHLSKFGRAAGAVRGKLAYPAVIGQDRIFPQKGGPTSRRQRLEGSFEDLLDRAKVHEFWFHDLRHTFASWYMMNGGDLYELAKLLGHANIKMTERYAKLGRAHITKTGNTTKVIWSMLDKKKPEQEEGGQEDVA